MRGHVLFRRPSAHGPATAEKIADAQGLDADATFRLMRACTFFGLMTYHKSTGSSAMPLFKTLRNGDPRSLRGLAIVQSGRGHWARWGQLDQAIRIGEPQAKATLGSSLWEYYATSADAEKAEAFTTGRGRGNRCAPARGSPADTRSVAFAVDVGCASGSLIHASMKEYRPLHGAVLDLPHVAADATMAAEALGLRDRLSAVGGDFFAEAPPAGMYLIKLIPHDRADEPCISILRNRRRAIRPDGRVVLVEIVVDEIGLAPFVAQIDLTMMVVLGGKERALEDQGASPGGGFPAYRRYPYSDIVLTDRSRRRLAAFTGTGRTMH